MPQVQKTTCDSRSRTRARKAALFDLPEGILHAVAQALGQKDRACLALTCRAAVPLLAAGDIQVNDHIRSPHHQKLQAITKLLKHHGHCTQRLAVIMSGGGDGHAVHLPAPGGGPQWGHMAALCHLQLTALHVQIDSLTCIRPQLRSLRLVGCPLHASSSPTDFFARGLSKLELLKLSHCYIDAHIGPVRLPSLTSLEVEGIVLVALNSLPGCLPEGLSGSGIGKKTWYDCSGVFAGGCPRCTSLTYMPGRPGERPPDGTVRAGYPKLKAARLGLGRGEYSVEQGRDWPLHPAAVSLPLTVNTLTCTAEGSGVALDLHAVLTLAASNIRDGVRLKALFTDSCATYVHINDMGGDEFEQVLEPGEEEIAAAYTPMARTLHGLVTLDLAQSDCSQEVLDALVAAAPDLRGLAIGWCASKDAVYGLQSRRRIRCSGLAHLTPIIGLADRMADEQADLTLELMDSSSLRNCCIKVDDIDQLREGDKITIELECAKGRAFDISVFLEAGRWHLRCLLGANPHTGRSRGKKLDRGFCYFTWGEDKAWMISQRVWPGMGASMHSAG